MDKIAVEQCEVLPHKVDLVLGGFDVDTIDLELLVVVISIGFSFLACDMNVPINNGGD